MDVIHTVLTATMAALVIPFTVAAIRIMKRPEQGSSGRIPMAVWYLALAGCLIGGAGNGVVAVFQGNPWVIIPTVSGAALLALATRLVARNSHTPSVAPAPRQPATAAAVQRSRLEARTFLWLLGITFAGIVFAAVAGAIA